MKALRYLYLALAAVFILGNHEGFLALWTGSGDQAPIVFPYSVASLPLVDQHRVNRGIRVETEAELNRLLEDFLS